MVGTYIERDAASKLANTGSDTETTVLANLMNRTSTGSVSVSFSIAKNATERLKWITEVADLDKLDWEGGIYTWEFESKVPNSNLSIVEVVLRRLSNDGTTVKASKSSGAISISLGMVGLKMGTITWNDRTQNPANRAADDRLEIVFRLKNANTTSAESSEVGTNTTSNELFFATPIPSVIDVTPLYIIIGVGRRIHKVRNIVIAMTPKLTHLINTVHLLAKYLTKIDAIQLLNGKSLAKPYNIVIEQLCKKSLTKSYHITQQIDSLIRSFYTRSRLSSMTQTHLWEFVDAGKQLIMHLSYIMPDGRKSLIRFYHTLQLTIKLHTHRLLYDILPYALTKVKHKIPLTRKEWYGLSEIKLRAVEVSQISALVRSKIDTFAIARKKQMSAHYYTLPMIRPDLDVDLKQRIKELEFENINLRRKLRELNYRGPRTLAFLLSCTGGVLLLFSYLYSSLILTFMGLGLTLWGIVIFYVLPSRQVPADILDAISLHLIKTLDNLLLNLGYNGRAIFHYPKYLGDRTEGYVFVPYDSLCGVPKDHELSKEKVFYDDPKGISIVAPSQGLVELFERELNVKFSSVDLTYLQENLPKLLIEDLRLIDDISMEYVNSSMQVRILGRSCAYVCDSINKQTRLGNHLGCPLCGSIALVISKVTGKLVMIKESTVQNDSIETSYLMLDA